MGQCSVSSLSSGNLIRVSKTVTSQDSNSEIEDLQVPRFVLGNLLLLLCDAVVSMIKYRQLTINKIAEIQAHSTARIY